MTLVLLASCTTDELCYLHPHTGGVRVEFDWSEAPDAAPESMAAYFYDKKGEKPFVRYEFAGRDGGLIDLSSGDYNALGVNSDHYRWSLITNHDNLDDFLLTTDDVERLTMLGLDIRSLPSARGEEEQRMACTPEGMLWSHRVDDVHAGDESQIETVTFTPRQVTCRYSVLITDVENIKYLHGAKLDGTISGMGEGFYHGRHAVSATPVTMPFLLDPDEAGNTLRGSFLTFGRPGGVDTMQHTVTVYMMFDDGSARYYTYDVTDQVRLAPDPFNVEIVISGLTLPKPIVNGGGFKPNVIEWEEVTEEIIM